MPVKVSVALIVPSKEAPSAAFECLVFPQDTVRGIKERLACAFSVSFPDQDLVFESHTLEDDKKLLDDCGVKEGASLDFVVRASEVILAQQLSALLQSRPLSIDELSLMYTYRFGTSLTKALGECGFVGSLHAFLQAQKLPDVTSDYAALDFVLKPVLLNHGTDSGDDDSVINGAALCAPQTSKASDEVSTDVSDEEEEEKDEDREIDLVAWQSVANRFGNVFQRLADEDFSEAGDAVEYDEVEVDVVAWESVVNRIGNVFRNLADEDTLA